MKGFFKWFTSKAKMKRWMLLIIVGILAVCYAMSNIVLAKLQTTDIIKMAISFVIGIVFVVIGIVFIQKRTLELLVEESDTRKKDEIAPVKSLIFNKKVYNQGPKIVVIGGGSGLNTVLRGLKNYTDNITAIVTVSDYGKDATSSRRALEMLPLDDIKESLVALSYDEESMQKLLDTKFTRGKLNGLSFSDIYFSAMNEAYVDFTKSIEQSKQILNITGKVLPVTLEEITICAELEDGTVIENRDQIPQIVSNKASKINRIYITPSSCRPAPGVIEAIQEADAIVIGPGSLYTNIIPNLLVKGIAKAIKESTGFKVYVSNIMTELGQTDDYTLSDHIKAINEYVGEGIIDYCIYDTGEIIPEYILKYNLKGSDIVIPDTAKAKSYGVKLIQRNLSSIDEDSIRHDSDVIASTIIQLVCDELKFNDMQNDSQYVLLHSKLKDKNKEVKKKQKENKISTKKDNTKITNRKKSSKFVSKYQDRIKAIQEGDKKAKAKEEYAKKKNKAKKKTTMNK